MQDNIKKVVIVGGGTAGWMSAASLAQFLDLKKCAVTLIESEQIGTVGVGEATLPHLRFFNAKLGIDEREFMRKTNATYKMGIEFVDWGRRGDAYIHPFGDYGHKIQGNPFHHYWLRDRLAGQIHPLCDYSLPVKAAKANKFQFPSQAPRSVLSTFSYAYHIDAGLYANYLRTYAEQKGVKRIEGKVASVQQHLTTGFIESVRMESGQVIDGELFLDCSGFRGLLIEQTLKTGYQDWSHWLICNSAQAIGCHSGGELTPYSRATAQEAGWQWRIPLQHRIGNGYVYSNEHISDEKATETLLSNLDGEPLGEPNQLRFLTGKRNKVWNKNCVAVGLSSGFLEPLESTSIYLIQDALTHLIEHFPTRHFEPGKTDEFNRVMDREYERIRDFLILHYHATSRDDSPFWNYVRSMEIPDSLKSKMELFTQQGHIVKYNDGVFLEPSWLAVYVGQGVLPEKYHPSASTLDTQQVNQMLAGLRAEVKSAVQGMSLHKHTLDEYLKIDSQLQNQSNVAASLYGVR